jgi:hypothetical protein
MDVVVVVIVVVVIIIIIIIIIIFLLLPLKHTASVKRFVSLRSVGLLGRGISLSQGRYFAEDSTNPK